MSENQKTVFISYRRKASKAYARLLSDRLKERGYDVFFDYKSLPAGRWEDIIMSQIIARAHFVVLLARGTLPDCKEPDDVLRKEIEHALRLKRNVVPIFIDGFDFKDKRYRNQLVGDLKKLPDRQGVKLDDLSDEFLGATLDMLQRLLDTARPVNVVAPTLEDQVEAQKSVEAAVSEPPPTVEQLSAEDYFNRAYEKAEQGDLDGAIVDYSEAIRLDPQLAPAYNNRGNARGAKGNIQGAIADYNEAIRLDPEFVLFYRNRGYTREQLGDLKGAVADLTETIRLDPGDPAAYCDRGVVYSVSGDLDMAIDDYTEAIRLDPEYTKAFYNRGLARAEQSNFVGAIANYTRAIQLDPMNASIFNDRGNARYKQDNLDGAIADYDEAIRLDPKLGDAYHNRGRAYFAAAEFAQAFRDFAVALKRGSERNHALAGLAIAQHALGGKRRPFSHWRKLVEEDPRYLDADWVGKELSWRPELIEAARSLIAELTP